MRPFAGVNFTAFDLCCVDFDRRRVGADFEPDASRLGTEPGERLADELVHVPELAMRLGRPGFEPREVEELLDEAVEPSRLALDRLREVAEEVAAEFEVIALAAVHRTGRLAIGDTAVLVAASARHRGQAYDASRALIDRLKERVPVWKHQAFADGGDEWVSSP